MLGLIDFALQKLEDRDLKKIDDVTSSIIKVTDLKNLFFFKLQDPIALTAHAQRI